MLTLKDTLKFTADPNAYLTNLRNISVWKIPNISHFYKSGKYLINTTNCRIPDNNPFSENIIQFVHKEEYTKCTKLDLLTYIDKKQGMVTLNINSSVAPQYSIFDIACCYSEIHRAESDDEKIRFTPCKPFRNSVEISHSYVKVTCRNVYFKQIYENVHATTLLEDVKPRVGNESFFSILFVGIDSISKQNLIRTMPNTYQYLEKHFVNMKGYNKIEDNTYPNLMAILTGQNTMQLETSCPFFLESKVYNKNRNFLSTCDFIWKPFSRAGYLTGLGEDATPMGTFNYDKKGYRDPPADYYYRPYFLAAEQIPSVKSKCHRLFCSGPENSGERVLNIAKDFSITFRNQPNFGFFWMNSFSHDNINCPSAMDNKVLQFLSDPAFVDSLKNTIFVFYSDHGYRYGGIRQTNTGWLEERLPFMYIFIPNEFQRVFPKEYESFLVNSRRLTAPYDLYNTLQHVLSLQDNKHCSVTSPGCSKCQSLFKEVPENRTCEDVSIDQHWCTCISYSRLPLSDPFVKNVAPFVVEEVNKIIQTFPEGDECVVYSFHSVHSAGISEDRLNEKHLKVNNILLRVITNPKAFFEATVEVPVGSPNSFRRVGGISRIDRYADRINCIQNPELQKYCYCDASLKKKFW